LRSILFGILIATVIGVVAAFVLSEMQRPTFAVYSAPSVRIGEPGDNLVGQAWSKSKIAGAESEGKAR
jgi:hypothetical protein